MEFSVTRLDIVFETVFIRPAFSVAQKTTKVLESIYDALSPRFSVQLSDLQVQPGLSFADVFVRVNIFGGNGQLELRVDKFTGRFQNLKTSDDVKSVKESLDLSEKAIAEVIPDMREKTTAIRTASWLNCGLDGAAAANLREKWVDASANVPYRQLGAASLNCPIEASFDNEEERWAVSFRIEPSASNSADLYFACNGLYAPGGKFSNLDERAEHMEIQYLGLLRHFGFEPPETR